MARSKKKEQNERDKSEIATMIACDFVDEVMKRYKVDFNRAICMLEKTHIVEWINDDDMLILTGHYGYEELFESLDEVNKV